MHHVKVAEIYKKNLFALDIVPIIEAEANFYVSIFFKSFPKNLTRHFYYFR